MRQRRRQNGAVLVISLIFLLVMTLIGVAAMQGVTLEEKMAGNMRSGEIAFQAAEAALREGEEWIMDINLYDPPTAVSSCSNNPCLLWQRGQLTDYLAQKNSSWWLIHGREYGEAGTQEIAQASMDPRYVIEYLGYDPANTIVDTDERAHHIGPHFYRVTAVGFGSDTAARRVLQTTVRTYKY